MEPESGIYRVNKTRDYFTASNEPFNDTRLSWEARGVMGYLLSKPDGWQIRESDLIKQGPAKHHKITRVMKELKACGYVRRHRTRNQDGTFKWVSEIYESSKLNPEFQETEQKLSTNGKSGDGSSTSRFSTNGLSTNGKSGDIVITESAKTERVKTDTTLRANDARAEPPQASLFTDIAPVGVQKPKSPEKQPTPKAPPDTQRMTEYIVLEWGVDSYARAGNIVKTLQGRLPKGHVHHAYNLSPPVTLEELEEFTIDYYPKACKGCSFPRSPEKIQDHFYSMRRERTNSDCPPGYIMTGTGLQEVCW